MATRWLAIAALGVFLVLACISATAEQPAGGGTTLGATDQSPKTVEAKPGEGAGQSKGEGDGKKDGKDQEKANELTLGNGSIYEKSLLALTMLFVLAVLLESAFATIFNWRLYKAFVDQRACKTLIMIVGAWIVVKWSGMDIFHALIKAYMTDKSQLASSCGTKFLTALILAGGSTGVYNIMYSLGFRSQRRPEELRLAPPKDKAWVTVRVTPKNMVGQALVRISPITSPPPPAPAPAPNLAPIAGTVSVGQSKCLLILWRFFFGNKDRFPKTGGYPVEPNTPYLIEAEAKDANDQPLGGPLGTYVFAPGAIVDLETTL